MSSLAENVNTEIGNNPDFPKAPATDKADIARRVTILSTLPRPDGSRRHAGKSLRQIDGAWKAQDHKLGTYFTARSLRVTDLDTLGAALIEAAKRGDSFLILGERNETPWAPDVPKGKARRKSEYFDEVPRHYIALDLDDSDVNERDPAAAAQTIRARMGKAFRDAACIWNATASHGLKPSARLRLYFWASRPVGLKEARALANEGNVTFDSSVANAVQEIYIANPVLKGEPDLVAERWGRLDGGEVQIPDDLESRVKAAAKRNKPRHESAVEDDAPMIREFVKVLGRRGTRSIDASGGRHRSLMGAANDGFDRALSDDLLNSILSAWAGLPDAQDALKAHLTELGLPDAGPFARAVAAGHSETADRWDTAPLIDAEDVDRMIRDAMNTRSNEIGSDYRTQAELDAQEAAKRSDGSEFGYGRPEGMDDDMGVTGGAATDAPKGEPPALELNEAVKRIKQSMRLRDPEAIKADSAILETVARDAANPAVKALAEVADGLWSAYAMGEATDETRALEAMRAALDAAGLGKKTATANTKPPLTVYSFDEAVALALDDDEEHLVEGVLSKGAMSVVYGQSNAGKSFVVQDMAFSVAAGIRWNGRETEKGLVVWVAAEAGRRAASRLAAYRKKHPDLDVSLFQLVTDPIDLRDVKENDADRLLATIRAREAHTGQKVALVVLDTLSRVMSGGDENSSVDMGGLVKVVDRVKHESGAHVCLIHHSGKDQAKGARGHSLLRAATDTEIEIAGETTQEGEKRIHRGEVAVKKQRDMEVVGSWAFHLEGVLIGTTPKGKTKTSAVVAYDGAVAGADSKASAVKLPPVQSEVMLALESLGVGEFAAARVHEAMGPARDRKSVHNAFGELRGKGLVLWRAGGLYRLPPKSGGRLEPEEAFGAPDVD